MQKNSILVALLGVLIGALSVLTYTKLSENSHRLHSEYNDWRKLNLIMKCIDDNYVDDVDRSKVTDAAISAALSALDPHSIYMKPEHLKASEEDLSGQFEGIGIQFNVPNDTAVVIEVIPGGPSEKIGLMAGDRLIRVDNKDIAGVRFPQDSMVRKMKGPAGTKVTVTVERDGELIPFEITRGKIPTWSVDASFMVNDTTGYIRLSKFAMTTSQEVAVAAHKLLDEGMRKLIFDIRDNTGGFFNQAFELSDMFLPKDAPIVYMEGKHRARQDYKASGKGFMLDIPLVVLINENSASSSEIFAGAIQDNHRGTIVGRRSFGKGLVQEPFNFNDGSGFRITVARFHTPSGRCIQKAYEEDYDYEIYKRYGNGEMTSADSMNVDKGGIVPDVFVPVDTTRASRFYLSCSKKATVMRFASSYFDSHKSELQAITDYDTLTAYLKKSPLESKFLNFAKVKDGLVPSPDEWKSEKAFVMTQVEALVGRYTKLNDNAYYHIWLQIDNVEKKAEEL